MILANQLQQFGLDNKEAEVYLATLEIGHASVQTIAQKAGIHRVTTYDIIEKLILKGLINVVNKGRKRYFVAMEPEKFLDSLRYKEQLFIDLMPELDALQNKGANKPKVLYFEGRKNIWNAYLDRIRHKANLKENLVYGSSEKLLTTFPEEYKKFTNERISLGVKAKIIVEKSKSGILEARRATEELREVKFLPEGKTFKSHTIIYGNRVMTISWDSMILVIIEDQANADNQRLVWEMLWNSLK
ncbi:MAG TPA: hypothetical protein DEB09_00710 [Candidatus Magasanikbacteria bacterium]|nr:hypothetical protein [Candidatus Magasanikbacteria bacterium]